MKICTLVIGFIALHCMSIAVAQDAAARKRYAEILGEEVVKKGGVPPGYNISAAGADATIIVVHEHGVTFPQCNHLATNQAVVSELEKTGFKYFACTDDGSTKFTFDLAEVSSQLQTKPLSNDPLSNDDVIQMVSSLQDTLTKGFPNMKVSALGNIITFADPKVFKAQEVRTAVHKFLQTSGAEAILCKYGFKKLRFESPEVTSGAIEEDDLRCTGTEGAAIGEAHAPIAEAPQQEKSSSQAGGVSGRIFLITKGGDLKPARLARVTLLYGSDAGTAAVVYLNTELEQMKGSYTLLTTSGEASCRAELLVFINSLKATMEWAKVNGKQDQVHIATSDEEGLFQFSGLEPGSYILLARGQAGANDAYWQNDFKVKPGESVRMKLASPHTACLD
jgi:hypothetical protein